MIKIEFKTSIKKNSFKFSKKTYFVQNFLLYNTSKIGDDDFLVLETTS